MMSMEDTWRTAYNQAGLCARLWNTGMPYAIQLASSGLLLSWLMLLPVQYIGADGMRWGSLLIVFMLSLLLLALDEVANQLEFPWHSLPVRFLLGRGFDDIKQ